MSDLSKCILPPTIVVLHGDQTGEELLQQALAGARSEPAGVRNAL